MGKWFVWDYLFLGLDCEGSPGFASLFDLDTGACLASTVTLGPAFAVLPFLLVIVISLRIGVSVTGPGMVLGTGGSSPDNTAARTKFNRCPLSKRHLSLLPFHTAPVVGCVVSSTTVEFKLLL